MLLWIVIIIIISLGSICDTHEHVRVFKLFFEARCCFCAQLLHLKNRSFVSRESWCHGYFFFVTSKKNSWKIWRIFKLLSKLYLISAILHNCHLSYSAKGARTHTWCSASSFIVCVHSISSYFKWFLSFLKCSITVHHLSDECVFVYFFSFYRSRSLSLSVHLWRMPECWRNDNLKWSTEMV